MQILFTKNIGEHKHKRIVFRVHFSNRIMAAVKSDNYAFRSIGFSKIKEVTTCIYWLKKIIYVIYILCMTFKPVLRLNSKTSNHFSKM